MANFFDQFDQPKSGQSAPTGGNFFDQFDDQPTGRKPTILPLKRVAPGQGLLGSSITFGPSELTESIGQAITAPRRSMEGDQNFDPVAEARNLALTFSGTGVAARAARPAMAEGVLAMNAVGPPAKKAAQGISRAATAVAQPLIDRVDPSGGIGRTLAKRLMQDNPGLTLEQAIAKAQGEIASLGPQATLADVGKSTEKLTRNLAAGPGETAQIARDVLGNRQSAEKTRMIESVRSNISDKDFYSVAAEAKLGRKKSGPLFQRAYSQYQDLRSPKLEVMASDPIVKKAMEKGLSLERMAATEAGEPFDIGKIGVVAQFNDAGDAIISQVDRMPLELWHATKRGIDKLLRPYRNPMTGKLDAGDPEVQALVGIRTSLDKELKTLTGGSKGDYAAANRVASDAYKLEDALDYGRSFARGDEEVTQKVFSALTPKEKDAFRAGVARELVSMIRKNTSDLTPAQIMAIAKNEAGIRKKLEFIVPTQAQFNNLMKDVENNLRFRETSRGIRNVSQTGSIAMEEGQLAADNLAAAGGVVTDIARGNAMGAVSKVAQWGLGQLRKLQMPQRTRDELGRMLLSQDPAVQKRAFDLIKNAGDNGWVYAP